MKAAVHARFGAPDVVRICEVEKPAPRRDEVLVKVHATTVNRTDCAYRSGTPVVARFFTPWRPSDATPPPSHLSRHVVAHQAAVEHFTATNALLSLMLVTSIIRTQQAWIEEVRIQDNP